MGTHILFIIDDDPAVRDVLADVLPCACDLRILGPAAQADWEGFLATHPPPDVIIYGLEAPVSTSLRDLARLRALLPHVLLIALTTLTDRQIGARARRAGADACLQKTQGLTALLNILCPQNRLYPLQANLSPDASASC